MKIQRVALGILFPIFSLFLSCATPKSRTQETVSAEELFQRACNKNHSAKEVQGSVWLKIRSDELSGQFSVEAKATAPDHLQLEFVNLLGGREATITINKDRYVFVRGGSASQQREVGEKNWNGIPLQWATDLFLGKVPCPKEGQDYKLETSEAQSLNILIYQKGDLVEKFAFKFREWNGSSLPEKLRWETLAGEKKSVEFRFDDPDDFGRARKWEVQSPQGALKIRWKDREITSQREKRQSGTIAWVSRTKGYPKITPTGSLTLPVKERTSFNDFKPTSSKTE